MDHLRQSQEDQDAGPPQPVPSSAVAAAVVQGQPNKEISKCTNTQCQRVFHTNCLMDWFERYINLPQKNMRFLQTFLKLLLLINCIFYAYL